MMDDLCKDCGTIHNRMLEDCKIPKAKYYVMSNDPWFSNFRGVNDGLVNTPVVPCDTYEEAGRIFRYIRSRGDQKRIRIAIGKPRHRRGRVLNLVLAWRERAREIAEGRDR